MSGDSEEGAVVEVVEEGISKVVNRFRETPVLFISASTLHALHRW